MYVEDTIVGYLEAQCSSLRKFVKRTYVSEVSEMSAGEIFIHAKKIEIAWEK